MTGKNVLFRTGMWYTISNFVSQGIVFICTSFFTRALTKAEFGEFNNFISVLNILVIIFTLNLEATYISAKHDYEGKNDQYLSSVLQLSTVTVILGMIFCGIFQEWISDLCGITPLHLWLMMAYILVFPAVNLVLAKARFLFQYKTYIFLNSGLSIFSTLLSIGLVLQCEDALLGRIIGYVMPTILVGLVCYVVIIVKGKKADLGMCQYALKVSLPYIPHLLSMTFLNFIDRIMITKICDADATAIYSLGYSCATIITVLMTSYNAAYSPWLAKQLEQNDTAIIKKVSLKYMLAFLVPVFAVILFAPELVWILGGKEYADAAGVVLFISVGVIFQFIYTMYVNIEQYDKKTLGMAVASVMAALINFVLNWIFIPVYGYQAAAVTTLVGYFFLLCAHIFLVYRMGRIGLYDTGKIIACILFVILFMFVIVLLYQNNIIRYIVTGIYLIFSAFFLYRYMKKGKGKILGD